MEKIDIAIRMLKELSLCTKYQKVGQSLTESNYILDIVCDELKEQEVIKCPYIVRNIFPYGDVLVPDIKKLKRMIK